MTLNSKPSRLNFSLGLTGVIIALLIIFFFNDIVNYLFALGQVYISEDHNVNPESIWLVQSATVLLLVFILLISFLFFINFYSRALAQLQKLFDFNELYLTFIKDDLARNDKLSKISFIVATCSAILLHISFLFFGEPTQEGYVEETSSLFILVSSIILLTGLWYLKKEYFSIFWYRTHQFTLIFLGLMLIFLYGEEINWGQRVLEIEPSEFFQTYNFQDEISFHNFFNPIFRFVYPAVGMGSFIILFLIWFFYKRDKNYYFKLFLPHRNLFFLIFWMSGASYIGDSEIYEEMLTVFFLLYSLRIFFCLKNLDKQVLERIK